MTRCPSSSASPTRRVAGPSNRGEIQLTELSPYPPAGLESAPVRLHRDRLARVQDGRRLGPALPRALHFGPELARLGPRCQRRRAGKGSRGSLCCRRVWRENCREVKIEPLNSSADPDSSLTARLQIQTGRGAEHSREMSRFSKGARKPPFSILTETRRLKMIPCRPVHGQKQSNCACSTSRQRRTWRKESS